MEKKLACYDIDGTLTKNMLATPLVISEFKRGFVDFNTCINLTKLVVDSNFGKVNYENAMHQLLKIHASGLSGQSVAEVKNHAEKFVQQHDYMFRKFGKTVIDMLRDSHDQILVTAEPQYIAETVQKFFKLDDSISTRYEIVDGIYTGEIEKTLTGFCSKLDSLEGREIHIAFGNTEDDEEILRRAENSFCISPALSLKTIALKEGWFIHTGKCPLIVSAVSKLL